MMKNITQQLSFVLLFGFVAHFAVAQSPSLQLEATNNNFVHWSESNSLIESNPDFTIEMWVKASTISSGSAGRMIYCEGVNSNSNMFRLFGSTGKVYIRPNGSSGAEQLGSTSTVFAATAVWHHIAVVGKTPGGLGTVTTLKLYIDGVEEASNTYTRNTADYDRSTLGNFTRSSSQTSSYAFDGEIDEFRTWNRALDATEILNNMCNPASTTGLVRHIRLNEGSGTTAYDEVTASSAAIQGTSPVWTTNASCAPMSVADDVLRSGINVYPNPVNDILTIKSLNTEIQIESVAIYDITGKQVYKSKTSKSINVAKFPTGVFILKVESLDGGVLHKKIIIN